MGAPVGGWRRAVVREVRHPHPLAVVLRLEVPGRVDHLPGQHYIIRLTGEDGYSASRSYSISSAPSDPLLEMYIERLENGEVSGYLADSVQLGDVIEVRGPIGGWFAWDGRSPAVGIGGGTGAAPLVAMLRHAGNLDAGELLTLAVAARTMAELPYAQELRAGGALLVISRERSPAGRTAGRLTRADLAPLVARPTVVYLCGSTGFAEAAGQLLLDAAVPPELVRVERFGPSG